MKVSIKMLNGKSLVRTYPAGTTRVRALFAVVLQEDETVREHLQAGAGGGDVSKSSSSNSNSGSGSMNDHGTNESSSDDIVVGFDLVTRFPVQSLVEKLDCTLEECELVGSQVLFRWMT